MNVPFEDINAFCDILLLMIKMVTVSIVTITPAKVRLSTTASPVTALSVIVANTCSSYVTLMHVATNHKINIYPELLLVFVPQY